MNHTPEWEVVGCSNGGWDILGERCTTPPAETPQTVTIATGIVCREHAELIAAAPDLLEENGRLRAACSNALRLLTTFGCENAETDALRFALAKAKSGGEAKDAEQPQGGGPADG